MKKKQAIDLTDALYGSNLVPEKCEEANDFIDDVWFLAFLLAVVAATLVIGGAYMIVISEYISEGL